MSGSGVECAEPSSSGFVTMTLQAAQLIFNGAYRIEGLIGEGAFAEVYRATDLALSRSCAVKVLRRERDGVGSSDFRNYTERFRLEARLGARMNHPNVIAVYRFDPLEDMLALSMEYAPGGSLADRIAKARDGNMPLPIDECVRLGTQVAQGLAAIHALDVVHRDLKPSNILLDAQGSAKVADLGLAQEPGGPSTRSGGGSLAQPHPGTPSYMSPEQRGTTDYLTSASDIYTLGLVLFEMLTGRNYRNLRSGTRVTSIRSDVPAALDDLIARMLDRDPEQRPWDGNEATKLIQDVAHTLEREEATCQAVAKKAREEEEAARVVQERAAEEARRQEAERLAREKAGEEARQQEALRIAQAKAAEEARIREAERVAREQARREEERRLKEQQAWAAAEDERQRKIELASSAAQKGTECFTRHDYDQAISQYSEAIELNPNNADYYCSRGHGYGWKGDYERAIAEYNKAIKLNPNNADYYCSRGTSYCNKGDYERAIADDTKAIELNPNNAGYYHERGKDYAWQRYYERAIAEYNKAIELSPNSADYYDSRGTSYHNKGDYERAIAEYNKAIELNPNSADYYYSRGTSYHNKGDYERAIADDTKAIELNEPVRKIVCEAILI